MRFPQAQAPAGPGPAGPGPAGPGPVGPARALAQASAARPDAGRQALRRGRVAAATVLPAADVLGLAIAVAVTGSDRPAVALYLLGVLGMLACSRLYRLQISLRVSSQAGRVLAAALVPALLVLPWLPSGQAAALAFWSAGLLLACRAIACTGVRAARRRGLLAETALIVGAGTLAAHLADLMQQHPELGLAPQGFVDGGAPRRDLALPWLGGPAELADQVARLRISRVIVSFASCSDEDLVAVLRAARPLRADVCIVPRLYELGTAVPAAYADEIWGIPLLPLRRSGQAAVCRGVKRALDVAAAAVLLAVAAPVLAVLAAALLLESGQSPLFRQVRLTGNGRAATILKLRTLPRQRDPDTCWTVQPRHCSRLGRLLRATHLDELPQLVNVLRGDMSLVGPRPERPHFARRFGREIARYPDRDRMPAGLTGWAQVHGLHGDTSISERCRFDNNYIENWSPWLDVVILARTVAAAFPGRTGGRR